MAFIKHKGLVINPAQIGYAERDDSGAVRVHMAMPLDVVPQGASWPAGESPPFTTSHVVLVIPAGSDADAVWNAIQAM